MSSFNNDDEFVTAEQAAQVLRVTDRQARRCGASGQIRSKRAGARVLLHAGGVHRLAEELRSYDRPPPPPQVVPQGELLQTIEGVFALPLENCN